MLTLGYTKLGVAADNWPQFMWSFSMRPVIKSAVMAVACATTVLSQGCAVVAVADAAVTTVAVVVKTGVKATGAVAGVAIDVVTPGSKDD